ncbi:uncharacterized protein LOC126464191 [Schistocerca serialis cubense]|uniref:uncharacterized protein LOC126464191 n=1 Tax=Schistocerca serialis cubense TaxID=2023355 RepID=UPI00214F1BAA|nr:uncharacterized protein LOC126464191 [Schistocerca serialis cubense]
MTRPRVSGGLIGSETAPGPVIAVPAAARLAARSLAEPAADDAAAAAAAAATTTAAGCTGSPASELIFQLVPLPLADTGHTGFSSALPRLAADVPRRLLSGADRREVDGERRRRCAPYWRLYFSSAINPSRDSILIKPLIRRCGGSSAPTAPGHPADWPPPPPPPPPPPATISPAMPVVTPARRADTQLR